MIDINIVRIILKKNGYAIKSESIYKQTGYRLKTQSGTSVFINQNNKYWCRGKQKKIITDILDEYLPKQSFNKKVFVVFGRDAEAKLEVEEFFSEWDLVPVFLSEEISSSETIIEQLERYMEECNYGIVLATPDDIGYLAGKEEEKKCRMRQNVVFEIGMLFFALGRRRTVLVVKKADKIEFPTDLSGIKQIRYKRHIAEIEKELSKELEYAGYHKK